MSISVIQEKLEEIKKEVGDKKILNLCIENNELIVQFRDYTMKIKSLKN